MTDEELFDAVLPLSDAISDARDSGDDATLVREALKAPMAAMDELALSHRNAELYYRCGNNWYFHPDRSTSDEIAERARQWFTNALEIDSAHEDARFALANAEYEAGRYDVAAKHFDQIPTSGRSGYFAVRTSELLLCCSIKSHGLPASAKLLRDYVRICGENEEADVMHMSIKDVLIEWVAGHSLSSVEPFRAELRALDRPGGDGWFGVFVRRGV